MISAEQIKKTRMELGESQAVFGERFGVDQATIHRWETISPPKRGPARKAVEDLVEGQTSLIPQGTQ
jgi:DNA-binding transcriptional regulator YiaG